VDGLKLEINMEAVAVNPEPLTVDQLIEHYQRAELCAANSKTTRTKQVYGHQLTNVISPRWGNHRLIDVKPVAVEAWLNAMPGAPGTKAKTKGGAEYLVPARHAVRTGKDEPYPARPQERPAIAGGNCSCSC